MKTKNRSIVRGLRDIRTHSGRVHAAGHPYMQYMKISALEMEKARRETEKFSSEARITNIDMRLAEIEAEKESLLTDLGERGNPTQRRSAHHGSDQTVPDGKHGFRIRY